MLYFRVTGTPMSGNKPRALYRRFDVCSCNLLFQTNNFALVAVLLSRLVSEQQEATFPGQEARIFYGVWACVPVISSSKQTKQKTTLPGLEIRKIVFQSFDLSRFSF
jgi:hypothetical protein